jgi:hypothetical protein
VICSGHLTRSRLLEEQLSRLLCIRLLDGVLVPVMTNMLMIFALGMILAIESTILLNNMQLNVVTSKLSASHRSSDKQAI